MQENSSTRPAFLKFDSRELARLDARVVRSVDIEQRLHARDLVEEAVRERDQARRDAVTEREKGYQDGFADGRKEALKITTAISLLVTDVVERWMNESEQQLSALLSEAFAKLIGVLPNEEVVTSLVREGLAAMGSGKGLVIKVADSMVEVAREAARTHADEADYEVQFSVVADASLTGTDVMVQTPLGVIDLREGSLKSQLSSMLTLD